MQQFFTDFTNLPTINDILGASNTGLWKIAIDMPANKYMMYANPTMLTLLSLSDHPTPEDCYFAWYDRIKPSHVQMINDVIAQSLESQQRFEIEYPWFHPVQGQIFVRCGGVVVPSTDGLLHLAGYHQDISELHATKLNLQKQLANLEIACEIANFAIFELLEPPKNTFEDIHSTETSAQDTQPCSLIASQLFFNLLAVDTNAPITTIWQQILSRLQPEMRDTWNNLLQWQNWQTEHQMQFECAYAHPEKEVCWLSLSCKTFIDDDNDAHMLGYITDITLSKMRELALAEAKNTAEAANLSKSSFLANMSHEIRTPMNAVLNMARLTLDTELAPKQRNFITKIHNSGKLMLNILNDILDFSKIEANKLDLECYLFNTNDELENVQDMIKQWTEEKGITFTTIGIDAVPLYLIGDALRTRQILINLLSNAMKFTPPQGNISLSLACTNTTAKTCTIAFSVQDTGIGMTEKQQKNLFTAFTQADTSITRRFGGTGLGLTICSSLTKLMGGSITLTSTVDVGTKFTVAIPYHLPTQAEITTMQNESIKQINVDLSGMRCLIVEDNLINQEILIALLESMHVDAEIAEDGQKAIDIFAKDSDFDCIFMDIQMPVMDGYTATKALRASTIPNAQSIPIIAMTANAMRGDDIKSFEAGMNAHLTKPVEIAELYKTLAKYSLNKKIPSYKASTELLGTVYRK